ncbi:Chemotaxis protein CheW [Fundidesulfovibrio magnetotacticus]|uniref:Chemotaxis protein CheW n=1 Tax=Fundidesulfovibrio magnetotacticus TaxID=2730080 RepID=A0A6V8LQ65_9BACT|nr:chemotaxis protein CheW [Fundidesulfovibrio magnetotacticus]GFK93874.1 Chemotaxis protein CheW [Fundidesulfovibrio magnetotacticus]
MSENTNQYLTFTLGEEVFALDIASVREVLEYTTITKVPRTPEAVRGVINLRGRAVPVVDVRLKFGMPETRRTVNTCIIIVEVRMDGQETVLGALADSVKEVMDIEPKDIEPAPRMGTSVHADFIQGIGKHGDDFIIILDIDKVFTEDELQVRDVAGEDSQSAA